MKQLIDYIPLVVFFSIWSLDERSIEVAGIQHTIGGIYSAAEFLIATSILVYGSLFLVQKRLDKFQWITAIAVILFCLPTIIFRNTDFLKWKAPIVYWIFAAVFLASRFIGEKTAIEHMMGHVVKPPRELWYKLNNIWIGYFVVLGAINLVVAFTLSEQVWIQFKVFGNLIITFVFIIGQSVKLAKYMEPEEDEQPGKSV
ncbi:MAG: septation protein IspZ [Gammaproteobacteria bacterium]|nr:septation protein IspZ [Gammaproteobacteria bacterium]